MKALAKKQKEAAGAKPKAKRRWNKRKDDKAPQPPAPQTQPQAQHYEPRRAASGVPPPEAFRRVKRLPAPNLPGRLPPAGPVSSRPPLEYSGASSGNSSGGKHRKVPKQPSAKDGKPAKAPKRKRPVNPARRRRRRSIAALLLIVVLIGGGVFLSVNLLFKIEKYDIQGESPYSVTELANALGHAPGDNMFGFSASATAKRITTTLPYVESVSIRRRLPSTIVFRVTAAQEGYYVSTKNGFAILSTNRKVLRVTEEEPEGLVRIRGLKGLSLELGQPMALTKEAAAIKARQPEVVSTAPSKASGSASSSEPQSDVPSSQAEGEAASVQEPAQEEKKKTEPAEATPTERLAAMEVLLKELADAGLEDIDWINVGDPLTLSFGWDGRITVKLGPKSGLEEKLAAVAVQLTDRDQQLIDDSESGTLDMTYFISTGRAYFSPE